jgi:hypothetical protein
MVIPACSVEAARRFGDTPGSFRVLVHQFRRDSDRPFFVPAARGPQAAPKADPVRDRIVALRKQNLSIYDINRILHDEGHPLGPVSGPQRPMSLTSGSSTWPPGHYEPGSAGCSEWLLEGVRESEWSRQDC